MLAAYFHVENMSRAKWTKDQSKKNRYASEGDGTTCGYVARLFVLADTERIWYESPGCLLI